MTVVINGTTGITSVNGSAAAPSVTGTDTDTGIVYGTNTLSLATGGVSAMTINASSRVFIGTSSAITPSDPLKMQIVGGNVSVDSGAGGQTLTLVSNDTTSSTNKGAAIGLGGYATDTAAYVIFGAIAGRYQGTGNTGYLQFSTLDSGGTMAERARIDASGNLLVGTTSQANGCKLSLQYGGTVSWGLGPSSGSGTFYVTNNSGTGVYLSSGSTSWAATSDERVKDIIEPIQNAAEKVGTLRAVIGKYKTDSDGVRRSFLIAQDVQAVLPEAVCVQDDELQTLGVQYTDTIPLLVAAIQEQQALIEQLRADVETLKGNV